MKKGFFVFMVLAVAIVSAFAQNYDPKRDGDMFGFSFGDKANAENVIVAMGSITETLKELVDYLGNQGEKLGIISVHLYRPFSEKYFFNVMPKSVKKICVLDRTKEPGANGEPLYLDIKDLFYGKENTRIIEIKPTKMVSETDINGQKQNWKSISFCRRIHQLSRKSNRNKNYFTAE